VARTLFSIVLHRWSILIANPNVSGGGEKKARRTRALPCAWRICIRAHADQLILWLTNTQSAGNK